MSIEGDFHPDKYALVARMSDARMGFLVVRPFSQKLNKFNILVNCGWIPEDMKHELFEIKASMKKGEVIGLVKRDENLEIKRTNKLYPRIEGLFNLIDLP